MGRLDERVEVRERAVVRMDSVEVGDVVAVVAAREDDGGVLVLSRFTGAARELRDALIVNPYSADEVAGALASALSMPAETRALRMSRLRRQVRENNVYRWAANLITDLASVRLPAAR